jgi:flagellar hook protein FlgE
MPDFSIPLSGLNATTAALSAISNNLANLNTVGYKDTRAVFSDLFYENLGTTQSGDPIQVGSGTTVGSLSTLYTAGSIESTGVSTDVAISGEGFFVVKDGDSYQYTRAGNFEVSTDGYLSTESGQEVMGYAATNGVVNTGSALGPLQVGSGQVSQPSATSQVSLTANLNSDATTSDSFTTPITVNDSLGGSHVLEFAFTKNSAGNWTYTVTIPAADVGQTGSDVTVKTGTLTFDSSGKLTSPTSDISGITVSGLADGAADMDFTWKLYDSSGTGLITQQASTSNTSSTSQNGFGSGTLNSFSIGSDGTIEGTFSNGKTMVLGQLALANFGNAQGLERDGNNEYSATLASGAAVIGVPGTGGRGTLTGGALEASNVDIATEFSAMISAERDYQANARAITTFDEIAQETINLKH